jgi:hypothetical protein
MYLPLRLSVRGQRTAGAKSLPSFFSDWSDFNWLKIFPFGRFFAQPVFRTAVYFRSAFASCEGSAALCGRK